MGNVHFHVFSNFLQHLCAKYFWEKLKNKAKLDKTRKFGVCFYKKKKKNSKNSFLEGRLEIFPIFLNFLRSKVMSCLATCETTGIQSFCC